MLYIQRMTDEVVSAVRWFKDGDHPEDESKLLSNGNMTEGKVVGFYRRRDDEDRKCVLCGHVMYNHGMLGDKLICPGYWIINKEDGTYDACGDKFFKKLYRKI